VEIETSVPLGRLTTIGTGGPAAAFARPASLAELEEAIAWAGTRGLAVRVVRPGDVVVTLGVGEPWRAARAIVAGLPETTQSA
jgi:UDP-N-acetylenolpyruvoylglucosamine reductase